jgi:hypothetical protein
MFLTILGSRIKITLVKERRIREEYAILPPVIIKLGKISIA